jgi:hypothetical protein
MGYKTGLSLLAIGLTQAAFLPYIRAIFTLPPNPMSSPG